MSPTYSLCLLTCNNLRKASYCMPSLDPLLARPDVLEMLVLDNGSTDGTQNWLVEFARQRPKVKLFMEKDNLGCAGGRNKLFPQAAGSYALSLDSDVEAFDDFLDRLTQPFLKHNDVGIVGDHGANIQPLWHSVQILGEKAPYSGYADVATGYCQLFPASALIAGVSVDPAFSPYWLEDADLCFQIRDRLHKRTYINPCGIRHAWSKTNAGDDLTAYREKWAILRDKWMVRSSTWPDDGETSCCRKAFRQVYSLRLWGDGSGNEARHHGRWRDVVHDFVSRQKSKVVVDLGCGDGRVLAGFDWFRLRTRYIGVDLFPWILNQFRSRHVMAETFDLDVLTCPQEKLPAGDLALIKDVLQHLPEPLAIEFLQRARRRYKHLLVCNCAHQVGDYPPVNSPIPVGGFRPIDLELPPFNQFNPRLLGQYGTKRIYHVPGEVL